MKNTSKILALVLVLMTVLMSVSVFSATAEEAANTATVTKVLEASAIGAQAAGTWADTNGKEVLAGTDDFFTLVLSTKSKVDTSSKEWTEEEYPGNAYKSGYRINLGGKSTSTENFIKFTTTSPATLKVWWVSNGDDISNVILDAEGNTVATIDPVVKNTLAFNEVALPAAGTYSFTTVNGSNYIFKIEVSWQVALEDPNACAHEWADATCIAPKTCSKCGSTEGEALGHVPGAEATCTTAQVCTVCDAKLVEALGHVLTFVNTLPTAEAAGKTVADCSVCNAHIEFDDVTVMTPGTYELDAAELAAYTTGSFFNGEVKVIGGVFACHLNASYRTDTSAKSFTALGWTSTHRMNFQGSSEYLNNGEGEEAVRNGGLKNYVQITTADAATVKIAWVCGGDGREIGIWDMEGNLVAVTSEAALKNDTVYSELTIPEAGSYLIGMYIAEGVTSGGNYFYKIIVDVEAPHVCSFSEPTCTEPGKCSCGATQGEALGHTWVDATCTDAKTCSVCGETEGEALGHEYVDGKCACGAEDPDYVAPVEPQPEPEVKEEAELNFFQKIIAWITNLFSKIFGIFKK